MANETLDDILFGRLLDYVFTQKAITITKKFHEQCLNVKSILENDVTGLINTVLNFAVDSAAEANYRIEIEKNDKLEGFLNNWLNNINQGIAYTGIVPGINELANEYFKETWQGSSLSLFRIQGWKEMSFDGNKIYMPTVILLVNGSCVYIDLEDKNNPLTGVKYYLGKKGSKELKNTNTEKIVVYKPYERWASTYPTPYIYKKGIYKNYRSIEILQDKGDELITKALPYLLLLKKGSEAMAQRGVKYDDKKLTEVNKYLQDNLDTYKKQHGKVPVYATPFDTILEHFIPEYGKILKEDLFSQSYRGILSGLGMVDIISAVSNSRQQSVLNPKPFIADVNARVDDVTKIIGQILYEVRLKNKDNLPKLFSESSNIKVARTPLSINTEGILDILRGAYDRGTMSIESWQEILKLNPKIERERRLREYKNGDEDIYYPHLIQNQENNQDIRPTIQRKEIKDKNESSGKQKGSPEANEYKNASKNEAKTDIIISVYDEQNYPKYLKKYPEHARKIWIEVWNNVYKDSKNEEKAFQSAWSKLQEYMKSLKK